MSAAESSPTRDPVDRLAEDFLERLRRGERPSISEYTASHPELAEDIRELFPALVEMEGMKSAGGRPNSLQPGSPPTPSRLGDYQILGVIGHGGMGIVYEALRESLRSHVALKIMHPRYRDRADYLRRFLVEARAAARMHHTNIVSVFDYGETEGVVYYTMPMIACHNLERVLDEVRQLRKGAPGPRGPSVARRPAPAGQDLATLPLETLAPSRAAAVGLLSGRFSAAETTGDAATRPDGARPAGAATESPGEAPPPPWPEEIPGTGSGSGSIGDATSSSLVQDSEHRYHREVARLGAQVADALAYAHRRGVLHRDIKPSNLLLDATGNVWVTDFGLAKFEDGDDLSQSRDVVGTLRYMAPERLRRVSSPAGDLYALGATLYELLTLRPLFEGRDQLHIIEQIANRPPVPPRRHDPRIPRDLETILLKAVAKEPRDRFASADDMAAELRRFVENRPILSRMIPPHERFWRWCRRNPALAALNGVAAGLLVAIAVVASASAARLKSQRDAAIGNLIRSYASEAEARRSSRRPGQRFEALDAIARAVALGPAVGGLGQDERLRLRNEAIAAMALPDLRVAREVVIKGEVSRPRTFTLDQNFERYAVKLGDGTVVVRRVADGEELVRLPGPLPEVEPEFAEFSPDGQFFCVTARSRKTLQVWDLAACRLLLEDHELQSANVVSWNFRPDGRELAIARRDGSIVFVDLPSGRVDRRWEVRSPVLATLAYSPDGRRIAFRDASFRRVQVHEVASGRRVAELPQPAPVFHLAWHPRRPDVLAVTGDDGAIRLWDIEAVRSRLLAQDDLGNGLVIAFHPDGNLLACRGWGAWLHLLDVRTGESVIGRPSDWAPQIQFCRDGRLLAAEQASGMARILELAHEGESRRLLADPYQAVDRYAGVEIDGTGQRLAASGSAGVVVWDLTTGAVEASLKTRGRVSHRIGFDPAGDLLTPAPWLLRWPVGRGPDGRGSIGPPRLVLESDAGENLSMSRDGQVIAVALSDGTGLVLDAGRPGWSRRLRPHRYVRTVAVSPDGRRVVTGSFVRGEGLRLWEARSGRLVHAFPDLPPFVEAVGPFSPDGRWLLAQDADGWILVDAVTGMPQTRLGEPPGKAIRFAPDSRSVACADAAGGIALIEVPSGRKLARLEGPEQTRCRYLAYSPDGTQLVAAPDGQPYLRAWDIRAIRRNLAALQLDWDAPRPWGADEGAARRPADGPPARPFRVDRGRLDAWLGGSPALAAEVLTQLDEELKRAGADVAEVQRRRGRALAALDRPAEAAGAFSEALRLDGEDDESRAARGDNHLALGDHAAAVADYRAASRRAAEGSIAKARMAHVLNNLAWTLVAAPAPVRDPDGAVAEARRAVALAPDIPNYINTLGVALYRAGRFEEAITVLGENAAGDRTRVVAHDLFFLAMAHHRMGHRAQARDCYDRAERWLREHRSSSAREQVELDAFHAEARGLLGLHVPDLPDDVFAP